MKKGRAGTMTHDYKRNGTTDLFAALNVATGEVLTHCQQGHTGADVLRFFKKILTDKRLRRGVFTSVLDLTDAITKWVGHWNDDPKPFVWHNPPARSSRR